MKESNTYEWKSKAQIKAEQKAVAEAIVAEFNRRGYNYTSISCSAKDFGISTYINVFDENMIEIAKIRISDHSVTNSYRVLNEYHVHGQSAKEVVDDILGQEV